MSERKFMVVGFAQSGLSDTHLPLPNTLGKDSHNVITSALGSVTRSPVWQKFNSYNIGKEITSIKYWRSVETGVSHIYLAAEGDLMVVEGKNVRTIHSGTEFSRDRPNRIFELGPVILYGNGRDNNVFYSPLGGKISDKLSTPLIRDIEQKFLPSSGIGNDATHGYKCRYVDIYGNKGPWSNVSYFTPGGDRGASVNLWSASLKFEFPSFEGFLPKFIEVYRTQDLSTSTEEFYFLALVPFPQDSYNDRLTDTLLVNNPVEEDDNIYAPNFSIAEEFYGRIFVAGHDAEPRVIRYTAPGKFAQFPNINLFRLPDVIVGFVKLFDKLVVFCKNSIFVIIGDSQGNFNIVPAVDEVGLDSPDLVQAVEGKAYFIYNKRIYVFDGFKVKVLTDHLEIFGDRAFGIVPLPAASTNMDGKVYFSASYDGRDRSSIVVMDTRNGAVFSDFKPLPTKDFDDQITSLSRYHDYVIAGTQKGELFLSEGEALGDENYAFVYRTPFLDGKTVSTEKKLNSITIVYSAETSRFLEMNVYVNGYEANPFTAKKFNLPALDDCGKEIPGWDEKNWGDGTWVENPMNTKRICLDKEVIFNTIMIEIRAAQDGEDEDLSWANIVRLTIDYNDNGLRPGDGNC